MSKHMNGSNITLFFSKNEIVHLRAIEVTFPGASLVVLKVNNMPAMQETRVQSLAWEDLLEKGMATHSSILAWRIKWTGEPERLQSTGSQRVGHDWETNTTTGCFGLPGNSAGKKIHPQCGRPGFHPWVGKTPWRRAWQPTPVFWPGESPWTEEPARL